MWLSYRMKGLDSLAGAARFLEEARAGRRVLAFDAPMGGGKTTLINALCTLWGVQERVTSPTFALLNEYTTAQGILVWHYDLYRVRTLEELLDLGIEEHLYSAEGLVLIEWPGLAGSLLLSDTMYIQIKVDANGARELRVLHALDEEVL